MQTPILILSSPWGATATGCRQELSSRALQREEAAERRFCFLVSKKREGSLESQVRSRTDGSHRAWQTPASNGFVTLKEPSTDKGEQGTNLLVLLTLLCFCLVSSEDFLFIYLF